MHDPKYLGECVIIMDELLKSLDDCFTKAGRGTQSDPVSVAWLPELTIFMCICFARFFQVICFLNSKFADGYMNK